MDYLYFDNAATTPVAPEVLEAMLPYYTTAFGNPSALHGAGREARLAVEQARKKIAGLLKCRPQCIVFTSGGTESANTAIRGSIKTARLSSIVTSPTEHACVLETARSVNASGFTSLRYVPVNDDGSVCLTGLAECFDRLHGRSLVCLMHANNEMGAMIDLKQVADICKTNKAVFFSDCVQTVGHYAIDPVTAGVDMISASAHKFHGPKGVGFLYVREGLELPSFVYGGGQEFGLRAGTENVAGIVGMARALEIAAENYAADQAHVMGFKNILREKLLFLGAIINGQDNERSLYTVLSARFPKTQVTESLLLELDMAGVAVSGGSACSAGKGGSHVIESIGASDCVNIRFSFSRFNTLAEVTKLHAILDELLIAVS